MAEMRTSYSSAAALTNFPLLVRVSSSELALSSKTVTANPTPFALNHQSSRTEQYDEIRVRAATSSLARQTAEYGNMTNAAFVRYEVLYDPGTLLMIR